MRMNQNRKKKNWGHESNVNSHGNSKWEWIKIGKKKLGEIINWGLTDKDKNKWEWIKGKKELGAWI